MDHEEYEHINDDFQDGWWLLPEYQDSEEERLIFEKEGYRNGDSLVGKMFPTLYSN